MEVCLNEIDDIQEMSVAAFDVAQVNRMKKEYGGLRQESKAPT